MEPSGDQEQRRPEPRNEPRRLAMEEIEQRHAKTQVDPYAPPPEPEPEPAPAQISKIDAAQQSLETPVPAPEPVAAPPPVPMVRVKVDGEEFEVPQADVEAAGGVTIYQKDRAADNRLRRTNESLAESKRLQAQMAQIMQQQVAQRMPPPAPVPTVSQLLQDNIDTIRWGTPEESASAFQKVIEAASPKLDPQQITAYAVSQMQQQTALQGFKAEFADVIANPFILKGAVAREQEILAEATKTGQRITDWAHLYRAIGNEARSAMGRPSQQTQAHVTPNTTDPTSQPVDKEARKASIVNLPTAAARAALPEAPKPETREDILGQLRKSRGLPTG
ncbi:MAG: hypothetical protein NUV75_07815 [Gallionella sp.]|nr:hypothetical protein [Gallionella sp.]